MSNKTRAYWIRTLHQWHWISAAVCLLGILLFGVTGITLNHAGQIEASPRVTAREGRLPRNLRVKLGATQSSAGLPGGVLDWVARELGVDIGGREAEWSEGEVYLDLPRPGGDAWLRIDRRSGMVEYESTDRGWISYLNDLHKGRHTGAAWRWFIDLFAVACLIFSLTGLVILKLHAVNRPSTWPLVGLGAVVPLLLAILFIH